MSAVSHLLVALMFWLPFAPADSLLGEWSMNLAKSRFVAGFPELRSQTMACERHGQGVKCLTVRTPVSGQQTRSEFTANYDGHEYPVTGTPDMNGVSLKRLGSAVVQAVFTKD